MLAAWLPHGRFRGPRRRFEPPLALGPAGHADLELVVSCAERPGTTVENAFLILGVRWRGAAWRIFARLAVEFDDQAAPRPRTELITRQSVGFSEASSA